MSEELLRTLGRLEQKVDGLSEGQQHILNKLDNHDGRLHEVEHRSKMNSYKAGGVAGIGVALFVTMLKEKLGM